jgi:hypothetical protein
VGAPDDNGWWETWKPSVTGNIIIEKPEGNIDMRVNYQGEQTALWYNRLEVYDFGPKTNAMEFTEARLDLYLSNGELTDGNRARFNMYTDTRIEKRRIYLNGQYTLGMQPGGTNLKTDNKINAKEVVHPKDQYSYVDQGMRITSTMDANYNDRYGNYPATMEFEATLNPIRTTDFRFWSNRFDAWFGKQSTPANAKITVHKPDGDETINVVWRDVVESGMGGSRDSNGIWHVSGDFYFAPRVRESGNDVNFEWGDWALRSYSTEPKYGPEGDISMSLEGEDKDGYRVRVYARGEYIAKKGQ